MCYFVSTKSMHGRFANFNHFDPKKVYSRMNHSETLDGIKKMVSLPSATDLVDNKIKDKNFITDIVPTKYKAISKDWYAVAEWRSMWRHEVPFDDDYPVQWGAFETTTKAMLQLGWTITLEFNRAVGRRKLTFRNKESGLMCRVPFEFGMPYIDITKLYAVKNYTLKAAKTTEVIQDLTEDTIPEILDWIREVKRAKISDFVCEQKQKEAKEKVIELGNYLHNQQKVA